MKRASFQNGSVVRKERKRGPDIWVFRYFDSEGKQKAQEIGTIEKYPTKAAALKSAKVKKLREEINDRVACIKVAGLCDRYEDEALPARHSTSGPYLSYLKRVRDDWGHIRVDELAKDVMGIEKWIDGLQTIPTEDRKNARGKFIKGRPARLVSKKTKTHMKWFLHRLFEYAIKWGNISMQRNPVLLVEVKGKNVRVRKQNLLTRDHWLKLIGDPDLAPHVRTMIYIAMLIGLRASEILGLRWEDINFDKMTIWIRRSHVGKHVDDTKTEESEAELPIHEDLATVLQEWREANHDDEGNDISINGWLFGNIITGRPFWRDSLQTDHLIPAGKKIGIPNLGWYDFRHTYRAMMRELEISLEEQRTLMRHEDIRTTLGYGGKASAEIGRAANAKVVEMLRKRA